jgi:hypothetical protein
MLPFFLSFYLDFDCVRIVPWVSEWESSSSRDLNSDLDLDLYSRPDWILGLEM